MAEIIALIIDIALGTLAYRLALANRKDLATLNTRVTSQDERLTKVEEYVASNSR